MKENREIETFLDVPFLCSGLRLHKAVVTGEISSARKIEVTCLTSLGTKSFSY